MTILNITIYSPPIPDKSHQTLNPTPILCILSYSCTQKNNMLNPNLHILQYLHINIYMFFFSLNKIWFLQVLLFLTTFTSYPIAATTWTLGTLATCRRHETAAGVTGHTRGTNTVSTQSIGNLEMKRWRAWGFGGWILFKDFWLYICLSLILRIGNDPIWLMFFKMGGSIINHYSFWFSWGDALGLSTFPHFTLKSWRPTLKKVVFIVKAWYSLSFYPTTSGGRAFYIPAGEAVFCK